MEGKELTIKFIADRAYITDIKPLKLKQTNLPKTAKSFKAPAYWKVRVLAYIPEEKRLHVEVLSYNIGPSHFGSTQLSYIGIFEEINRITFRTIDTLGLLNTLNGIRSVGVVSQPLLRSSYSHGNISSRAVSSNPAKQTITDSFSVPIKNLRFKQGRVTFERKLKGTKKKQEFEILNSDIIEEFDAIKNYFANVLKIKKVMVSVTAEVIFNAVIPIKVTSPEIDQIDRSIIEDVKLETVRATTRRNITVHEDATLFTMDEYFHAFGEENFKPSVFYKEDKELLNDLVYITETKHYKHLAYLSRNHDSDSMKLRFVHKPMSFVFLMQGAKQSHFVWETLDTEEATYVWHFQKGRDLRQAFKETEGIIRTIKAQGKTAYIDLNNELFTRIKHKYKEGMDGFEEWKRALKEVLI